MASKRQDTTALATIEREANTAMAVADAAVRGDARGTEGIDQDDIRVPFLAIAQKTSKALDRTEGGYIQGLEFGQLYNSETREIYGDGPVEFIPLAMRKRAHLVDPDTGRNGEQIDWNDPRATWDDARARGLEKPEGRRIYDWVVLLVPTMEQVIVSFASKSLAAGKSLNNFVVLRKPAFAGKYALGVTIDKNDAGTFGKFTVKPAGKPTADEFAFAQEAYEAIAGRQIATTDEPAEVESALDGEVTGEM